MIYFISGLGADERVFQFLDLGTHSYQHIHWIATRKEESLASYAKRLSAQIDATQDVILVGVSFGGMIAQEIGKFMTCKAVIIISSVKSPTEFDWKLKSAQFTQAHRIAPAFLLKWSNLLTANYFFGASTKQDAQLLRKIVLDTDTSFLKWAIHVIMNWKNTKPLQGIHHIHGTNDKIFPHKPIKNAQLIDGGGHFMIVNKAAEISPLILDIIEH